jgi:hypothetical protein
MRNELSVKETWEWIVAEIHAHGLRQRAHHTYKDSDLGRLANKLLEPTERVLMEMNDRQRGHLVRDLRARLGSIATLAELRSTRSFRKR